MPGPVWRRMEDSIRRNVNRPPPLQRLVGRTFAGVANGAWVKLLPVDGIKMLLSHPLASMIVGVVFFQAMAGLGFNQVLPFFLKLRLGWGATEFGNWMGWNCMRPIRLYSRSVIYLCGGSDLVT